MARAAVLAAEAVAVAERVGAVEPLCEALDVVARCAQQDGDVAAAAAAFRRAASVAAEHGLLKQQVEAEFGRALLTQTEDGWRPELLARPRELALAAGMLADVARIDLIVADNALAADGPAAAEPLAEACVALTGALRLSSLQAVMQMILALIRAALGDAAAAQRLLESALAQPDRAPDVPAHASMVRAFPALLAGDLVRADTLMRPGMQALLGYPAAPPLAHLGLWVLLCAVCGDDEPARGLARRGAARRRVNRAALAYAAAVDAGRSGAVEEAVPTTAKGTAWVRHAVVDPAAADAGPPRGLGRRLGRPGRRRRRAADRPRRARAPRRPPARPHLP